MVGRGVLLFGTFVVRGMIRSFWVGRESVVRFGLWLYFMFSFGLRFQNIFVSTQLVTFYLVSVPLLLVGCFGGLVFLYALHSLILSQ